VPPDCEGEELGALGGGLGDPLWLLGLLGLLGILGVLGLLGGGGELLDEQPLIRIAADNSAYPRRSRRRDASLSGRCNVVVMRSILRALPRVH